jgi:glutaredoxin
MHRIMTLFIALTGAATALAQSSAQLPAAAQSFPSAQAGTSPQTQPAGAPPVVMYATAWCPYCAKARAYFKRTGTAYTEHDIEKSAAAHAQYKRLGGRGVPLILVGDEKMAGFSELAFESLLARATHTR